jgi:hypothetical protein
MVRWGQAEGRRWGVGWGGANVAHFMISLIAFVQTFFLFLEIHFMPMIIYSRAARLKRFWT